MYVRVQKISSGLECVIKAHRKAYSLLSLEPRLSEEEP